MVRVDIEHERRQVVLALLISLLLDIEGLPVEGVLGHHVLLELVEQVDDGALTALSQHLLLVGLWRLAGRVGLRAALDALPLDLGQPDLVSSGLELAVGIDHLLPQAFAPQRVEPALVAGAHDAVVLGG